MELVGVILAGGRGRRFAGKDKGLILYNNNRLIEYAIDILRPVTPQIVISANRNHQKYQQYSYPVIPDLHYGFSGPLEGIYSAMCYVTENLGCNEENTLILTMPCDMPAIPANIFSRLLSVRTHEVRAAVYKDANGLQPLLSVLPLRFRSSLGDFLMHSSSKKAREWILSLDPCILYNRHLTLQNINSPLDLE